MIFVSVGTHNEQFNRLLKEIDMLVEKNEVKGKVIAQIGYSDYKPKNYRYFRFTSWKNIINFNKKSDIVVTHGGAGNLILASHFNKTIVAVPRMKRYREHLNDHQVQLVKTLEKQGRVIAVYDMNDLGQAIKMAKKFKLERKSGKKRKENYFDS